jgi:hypothetical protein
MEEYLAVAEVEVAVWVKALLQDHLVQAERVVQVVLYLQMVNLDQILNLVLMVMHYLLLLVEVVDSVEQTLQAVVMVELVRSMVEVVVVVFSLLEDLVVVVFLLVVVQVVF